MKFNSKYVLILLPILLSLVLIWVFRDIVSYIVIAWVLSMIVAPIMRLFKKILPTTLASLATILSFTLVVALMFLVFLPPLVQQGRNLAGIDYERLADSLQEPIDDWNTWLINKGLLPQPLEQELQKTVEETDSNLIDHIVMVNLDSLAGRDIDSVNNNLAVLININNPDQINKGDEVAISEQEMFFEKIKKNILSFFDPSQVPQLFGSVFGFVTNILITALSVYFILFFFLKEQGLFERMIQSVVSNKYENQAVHALDESSKLLIRYFFGVAIQIIIITIFVSTSLKLFGIKNALLIGFFAALMNVIPYIGPIIGAAFGVIITVSSNLELGFYDELLPLLIIVVGVFAVMQLLDNFLLQPNIFSKSVKAHPLEIFIVVLAGAQLGGITGMVLAIPAYTVLRVLARVFLSEFKIVQSITKDL